MELQRETCRVTEESIEVRKAVLRTMSETGMLRRPFALCHMYRASCQRAYLHNWRLKFCSNFSITAVWDICLVVLLVVFVYFSSVNYVTCYLHKVWLVFTVTLNVISEQIKEKKARQWS